MVIGLYFTHLPRSPPWADFIWNRGRPSGRRRNHLCQISWRSVKGVDSVEMGFEKRGSHREIRDSLSPLTLSCRYRAASDYYIREFKFDSPDGVTY